MTPVTIGVAVVAVPPEPPPPLLEEVGVGGAADPSPIAELTPIPAALPIPEALAVPKPEELILGDLVCIKATSL